MALIPYTKPAADVLAEQWAEDASNTLDIISNFDAAILAYQSGGDARIWVTTPDGSRVAYPGNWFVKTEAGDVTVWRAEDFTSAFILK